MRPGDDLLYARQQLQVAYGIKPLLDRGIDGRGETVVLPELAETQPDPPLVTDLRQDMAGFDGLFHLPAARMRVVTTLAGAGSPWLAFGEEVLDVEVVHALAPDATLVILLLPSTSLNNTPNAVAAAVAELRLGPTLGSVMSISAAGQIGGEHCVSHAQAGSVNAALQTAVGRGMTVVAASGDIGAAAYQCDLYSALTGTPPATPAKGVLLLASDPLVLAAGGTSLTASHATGAWTSETAWGLASGNPGNPGGSFQASGGGFSQLFARPAYQAGVPGIGATRGIPDVSADASDRTGVAVVFSNGAQDTVQSHGGTSASAPIWAALIALADQYAGHHLGFVNPAIYQIARSPRYHQAFHDITTGNNTVQFPPTSDHRLPGRTRLGSGHRLGQPQRPDPHPPARPLRQPLSPASQVQPPAVLLPPRKIPTRRVLSRSARAYGSPVPQLVAFGAGSSGTSSPRSWPATRITVDAAG